MLSCPQAQALCRLVTPPTSGCGKPLFLPNRERVEAAKLIQRARARPPVGVMSGLACRLAADVPEEVPEGTSLCGFCRVPMPRRSLFRALPWSRWGPPVPAVLAPITLRTRTSGPADCSLPPLRRHWSGVCDRRMMCWTPSPRSKCGSLATSSWIRTCEPGMHDHRLSALWVACVLCIAPEIAEMSCDDCTSCVSPVDALELCGAAGRSMSMSRWRSGWG